MLYTYHHACVHIGTMDSLPVYNISARAIPYCTIIVTDAVVQLECDYVSKIICGSPGLKTTMYCVKVLYH